MIFGLSDVGGIISCKRVVNDVFCLKEGGEKNDQN